MRGLSRNPSNRSKFTDATGNRQKVSQAIIPELGSLDLGARREVARDLGPQHEGPETHIG